MDASGLVWTELILPQAGVGRDVTWSSLQPRGSRMPQSPLSAELSPPWRGSWARCSCRAGRFACGP